MALLRARAAHWVSDELVLAVVLVLIVLFCAGGLGGSNAMAKIETSVAVGSRHLLRAYPFLDSSHFGVYLGVYLAFAPSLVAQTNPVIS